MAVRLRRRRSPAISPRTWRAAPAGAAPAGPDRVDPPARRRGRSTSSSRSTSAWPATSATSSAWSRASRRPRRRSRSGSGSCRDTGWLLVQLLRHLGLRRALRLRLPDPAHADVKALDGPSGTAVDFTDLHAWAEVYLPGAGWIGLDPTSGLLAGEGHIPLACTPSPRAPRRSAAPSTSARSTFSHHAWRCTRVCETRASPSRTPRSSGRAIDALGARGRRASSRRGDVRLTMGGEPTFVSIDDPRRRGVEHRGAGPAQAPARGRAAARACSAALRAGRPAALRPGQVVSGRAAAALGARLLVARRRRADLARRGAGRRRVDSDLGHDAGTAQRFIEALATRLGVEPGCAIAGYEDVWYYLWQRAAAAGQRRPAASRSSTTPEERARLAQRVRAAASSTWSATRCRSRAAGCRRAGRLALAQRPLVLPRRAPVPAARRLADGLSPAARLAAVDRRGRREHADRTGSVRAAPPLPPPRRAAAAAPRGDGAGRRSRRRGDDDRGPAAAGDQRPATSATWRRVALSRPRRSSAPRSASSRATAAARLPAAGPRPLEDYLDLVAAVEATAGRAAAAGDPRGLHAAARSAADPLQGHARPRRDRGQHPSGGELGRALSDHTTHLYEEARQTRLGTEKFMLDGRHTGTGGGNHIVLGGADAGRQPVPAPARPAAQPDRATGTTTRRCRTCSRAVHRPDQPGPARRRGAQRQRLRAGDRVRPRSPDAADGPPPPWLVDRSSATCWSTSPATRTAPSSASTSCTRPTAAAAGSGLVELRAFEMPPHARMSLAQQLLLRALVARFWDDAVPARARCAGAPSCTTASCCRTSSRGDFEDVIDDLHEAGFAFEAELVRAAPRVPLPACSATVAYRGVELELRQAIEPWHVLGEEAAGGGTARYVDSSVERLAGARSTGLDRRAPRRRRATAARVPLHPTGTHGEFVAGVRYRAWQPPSCLHPTIPVHAPLVFDLVDTWTRPLARRLHVPRARIRAAAVYDTLPGQRLRGRGPPAGAVLRVRPHAGRRRAGPHTAQPDPQFPLTLDLRRADDAGRAPVMTTSRLTVR